VAACVEGKISLEEGVLRITQPGQRISETTPWESTIETLRAQGGTLMLAAGPVLTGEPEGPTILNSLLPGADDWEVMLTSLAQLYAAGVSVDWAGFDRAYPRGKVTLPTYPFQRQ